MVGKKLTFRTYVHSDVCIVVDRLDRYLIADDNLLKPPPRVFPPCPVSTPSTFDFPDVPDTVPTKVPTVPKSPALWFALYRTVPVICTTGCLVVFHNKQVNRS